MWGTWQSSWTHCAEELALTGPLEEEVLLKSFPKSPKIRFMNKVPLFLGLVAAILSLASCEKELNNSNTPTQEATAAAAAPVQSVEEKTTLLTTGDWKLMSMAATSRNSETNLLVMLKADQRDDLSQFRAEGKLVLDEGSLKRDAEAAQQTEGVWAFGENDQKLAITAAGNTTNYSVAELSATKLRLTRTEAGEDGQSTVLTSVYGR